MNEIIKHLINTGQPMITNLDEKEQKIYKVGLGLLATIVCDDFFDLPMLPSDKYETDGLFYSIPYYDSDQLLLQNNQRMLLVVYKIHNKTSGCPLRIDFKFDNVENFTFFIYDQSGERTYKKEFISRENGEYFTQIDNYDKVKLSELVSL